MFTQHIKHCLATMVALFCSLAVYAEDFEVDGIYYNITSSTDLTVEVTFQGNYYDSYSDEYSGAVTIPSTVDIYGVTYCVTSIGDWAFYECGSLTSITIPESVTSIGDDAFNCSSLNAVYISSIEAWCDIDFSGYGSNPLEDAENLYLNGVLLTDLAIPYTITTIKNNAFYGCNSLAAITIPASVKSIGDNSFRECCSLTSITIPESVTSIGNFAFTSCSSLASITVDDRNSVYDSRNNCNAIIETSSNTLVAGCLSTVIPATVTSIGAGVFADCCSLTVIDIPEGVTSIGDNAFFNCSGLTSITIPSSVTSIGYAAFSGCSNLNALYVSDIAAWCNVRNCGGTSNPLCLAKNLYLNGELVTELIIPESVTSIGYAAFSYCSSLTSIIFPEAVTSIGADAFSYCSSLTSITCKAVSPPSMYNSYSFYGVNKSIPIYVPASSVESYKSAEYWSEFTNIRPITNEYPLTVSSAGYAAMYLEYDAEIPDNVKVYIATSVEGDRLMMTRVTGVLPAETGVIVRAEAGEYTFVESDEAPANVEGNLLSGTATDTYITAESGYRYYVLAQKEGVVGMYRPKLTNGQFLNNANKAYLALDLGNLGIFDDEVDTGEEGGQLSNRLRFDFGGTTDVEMATGNGGQTTVIYDLQGRRVEKPTKPGIYIVNGKKVIFK